MASEATRAIALLVGLLIFLFGAGEDLSGILLIPGLTTNILGLLIIAWAIGFGPLTGSKRRGD